MPMVRRRRRRRYKPPFELVRFWWVGLILAALLVSVVAFRLRPGRAGGRPLTGYLSTNAVVGQEYARYYGKRLNDRDVLQQLERSNNQIARRDYAGAAATLETVAKSAAVPSVFNNLGVLYAELADRARCINAFREALVRDPAYRQARDNVDRLKGFMADSAEPVTHEIEPNDNNVTANIMATDIPVEGEIDAGRGDIDSYRIITVPPPRDIVEIEVVNRSQTLIPTLRIYNADSLLTELGRSADGIGGSITVLLVPEPNTTYYLQVLGLRGSGGEYTIRMKQRHAADVFEPNDDIFSSRPITPGQAVDANIMDNVDTDFYSFRAPRTGTVEIDIQNRSSTLVPALTTFAEDMRNLGFGPDIHAPGASLHHSMEVRENQTYYLQVWAQGNTAGQYSLTVK